MSSPSSMKAVVAALAANTLITISKFVAFAFSGSGAMLSEAVHSAADAGNQFLLFLGLKRSVRQEDDEFNYGFGPERFVFGLLSAAGIFFIGCGVTVYHGITALLHPHEPEFGLVTVVVLALSFLLEGYSFYVAVSLVWKQKGSHGFFEHLFENCDPATVAIVLEDAAAMLGLLLATLGIGLTYLTGNPTWDAVGSILVGLLLGFIAVYLARENREFLLGKAVPHEVSDKFRGIVSGTPGVRSLRDVKTRQITPEIFKLKAEISVDESHLATRLSEVLPDSVAQGEERRKLLQALAEKSVGSISDLIDDVEERVRAAIPEAHHIDLEVDHTDERRAKKQAKLAKAG